MLMNLKELIETDPEEAERQCVRILNANPNDALALFTLGQIYSNAEMWGLALAVYEKVVKLRPDRGESWNNLGMCHAGLRDSSSARDAFRQALKCDPKSPLFKANLAMVYFGERDLKTALRFADEALRLDPNSQSARNTKGLCLLSLGRWSEAWEFYASSVGSRIRKRKHFAGEPMWDGSPGKRVVFYGEQGLGDEIMYASCIDDMQARCEVTLECDPRLAGLFKRSFPSITVHGTRREDQDWSKTQQIDASLPVGQMPQFCRPTPESCPGKPYLVADPERRLQWRALFDSWGSKPKIGICWTGGTKNNKAAEREIGLENLRPLIESIDADWISLQYKDPTAEIEESGLPVRHYRRACETEDYDDTAAMVAELDAVIGVHTSVHHLAGALGVPGFVLVPSRTIWIYELVRMHWYSSALLFRQNHGEPWRKTIERLTHDPALGWLRSPRGSGIPYVQSVRNRDGEPAGRDLPAGAAVTA